MQRTRPQAGLAAILARAEALEGAEDASHAADGRAGRVVRVEHQAHAGLLGHRQHGLDEVLVVGPHRVIVEGPVRLVHRTLDEWVVLRLLPAGDENIALPVGIDSDGMVVAGHDGAAPAVALRCPPDLSGKEVIAEE